MSESDHVRALRSQLGRQLKALREAAGLTQSGLASRAGYARGTVSHAEIGRPYVARPFWEQCDTALSTGGELATGFDEIRAQLAAERGQAASSARAARRSLAASAHGASQVPGEATATVQPCPHCCKPVIVIATLHAPAVANTSHGTGPASTA